MKNMLFRGLTVLSLGSTLTGLTSCNKDLDQVPKYETTADKVYANLAGYKQGLGKIYGGYALTGLDGAGSGDIAGIDFGTSDYLRQLWSAQELTTDEAVVAWANDPNALDWHAMNWDPRNILIQGLYNRCYYEISICNEFIRESTDDKLSSRLSGTEVAEGKNFRNEARFLRAVSYYNVIDLFGGGPFVTDANPVGATAPPYYTRKQLYDFVERELNELTTQLPEYRSEYGRVDRNAAKGYLARLYLNAGVYTGTPQLAKAAEQAKSVIDANKYNLNTTTSSASSAYGRLFLQDNNVSPAANELIWPILYDVNRTQSFGGTTFLVNGSTSSSNAGWQRYAGQKGGWNGLRATRRLVEMFPDTAADRRGRFWTQGQTLDITDVTQFSQGYGVVKYRNVTSDGTPQGLVIDFSGVDYPMLRLAEMHLIYAEAAVNGNADRATALGYINAIRSRAFPTGNRGAITDAEMTVDFVRNERARELHWEGTRRSDLIRYGQFVEGTYLWPLKGDSPSTPALNGRAVEPFRVLFPLPSSDIVANPNLIQNQGYN